MNSGEFKKNKLFYMNYIYILTSAERLLTHECTVQKYSLCQKHFLTNYNVAQTAF